MLSEKIISIFVPHDCIGCDLEGALLCNECVVKILPSLGCSRCSNPSSLLCQRKRDSAVNHLFVYTRYDGLAKELIQRLKFERTPAAAGHIAGMLSKCEVPQGSVIVPVRTSPLRYRQRGYDQTVLISRSLAQLKNLPMCDTLMRSGSVRQLGAKRSQRLLQQQGLYWIRRPEVIVDRQVLLVDDVRTTGATLESAATALLAAGAKSVDGLVFAQA